MTTDAGLEPTDRSYKNWKNAAVRELAAASTKLFVCGDYVDALDGGRFESIMSYTQSKSAWIRLN
jgi:hypothetical protein